MMVSRPWLRLALPLVLLLSACGSTTPAADAPAPPAAVTAVAATSDPAPPPTTAATTGGQDATAAVAAATTGPTLAPAAGATQGAAVATTAPAGTSAPSTGAEAAVADQGPCTAEAASGAAPTDKARMVIGTGGTGGVFFPYGGGLARILTEKMGNAEATAEETGGSVDNMKLVGSGDADIGFSTVDSAYDAAQGQGAYTDVGKLPACAIAVLYQSFVHIVALDGSGIATVEDMKGKRVSVGSAGSSTEGAADRVLEAAGLDPKADITRDNLSVAESVAAMKDGKIDAFFWIGGLPTSAVTDLVSTPNLKATFIPASAYVDSMVAKYGPVYQAFDLPAGIYTGVDQAVPGIGIGNILFVNAAMPEQQAYDILKTMFDNLAEVQQVHPEAKKLSLETAAAGSSIPLHPGAIRFYQEQGVLKP